MVVHQLQSKVRFRFEPPWCWLNLELDFRFGSGKSLNLELNLVFGSAGSGSNLGSEPNCGITKASGLITQSLGEVWVMSDNQ